MLLRNNLLSNNKMKSELVIHFLKKYKKEILQWIFVIIFCQTFDFKQIAYTREFYDLFELCEYLKIPDDWFPILGA